MRYARFKRGEVTVVRLATDRLTHREAPKLDRLLTRLAEEGVDQIVLDLAPVRFVDSSALVVLTQQTTLARERAGGLKISGLRAPVARVIEQMRLHRVLQIHIAASHACRAYRLEARLRAFQRGLRRSA